MVPAHGQAACRTVHSAEPAVATKWILQQWVVQGWAASASAGGQSSSLPPIRSLAALQISGAAPRVMSILHGQLCPACMLQQLLSGSGPC